MPAPKDPTKYKEWINKLKLAKSINPSKTMFKKGHKSKSGEKHYNWKGNNLTYNGIHTWIRRFKKRPDHCEICGDTSKRRYNWANIDHQYRRVKKDYINMCMPCHSIYDRYILEIKMGRPKKII